MEKLQRWLKEQCEANNWSWREASIKAQLNPGSLSAIITGGQRPGLETCKALAKLFRVSPILVLQMAGHIESAPVNHPAWHDPSFIEVANCWPDLTPHHRNLVHDLAVSLKEVQTKKERGVGED